MAKKHIRRAVLIGIPTLPVCLFVLSIIVLNTTAFHNFLRSEIVKQAHQRLGARVEIGSIETHWTRLGVDVNGIVLYGNEANAFRRDDPALLRANRLQVGLVFLPLFRGKVHLRELIIDQPVVRLRVDANGHSNLPTPPATTGSSNGVGGIFDLQIANCEIRSGQIFYNDAQTPLDAELHDVMFQAGYRLLSGQYTGSLSYDRGRLSARQIAPVAHDMSIEFAADRAGLTLSALSLTVGASKITANARLTNYEHPVIDGSYQATLVMNDVATAMHSPSLPLGVVSLDGKLGYHPAGQQSFVASLLVEGKMRSDKLAFRTNPKTVYATSLSANYELKNAALRVQDLDANVLGGHAHANWEMEHIDARVSSSRLEAALTGISLSNVSDTLAPPKVRRIPFEGAASLVVRASWTGSASNAIAHARLAIVGPSQAPSPSSIPVNGLVDVDFDGPQNTLAFSNSYLQTANTRVALSGTLNPKNRGNSMLLLAATTGDLGEVGSLVNIVRDAVTPSDGAMPIPALSGSADLRAQITGSAKDPRIQGQLSAQNFAIDGTHWRSLAVALGASSSQASFQNGALVGMSGQRISFNAKASLQNWTLVPNSSLSLQASVANMPVADIQEIAHVHYPVSGTLSGQVSISGTKASPQGTAHLALSKASAWNEPINNLTLNADARQNAIHSMLNLQLPAGTISADATYALATQAYSLNLQGNGIHLDKIVALQRRSAAPATADLSATGIGTIHNPQLDAKLSIPQLQIEGQTISNIAAQIGVANQHAALALQSSVSQGTLDAKGDVQLTGSHNMTATLDLRALPVAALVADFAPEQASKLGGQTELHLSLNGPLSAPAEITAHLQVPALNVTYGKAELALAKPLEADYRAGTLTVQPSQITGTGTNLTFGGTVPIKSNAAYSLVADGSIDLGVMQQFAPTVRSGGQIEIHLRSTGRSSGMQGQLQLKNAVFSTQTSPIGIEGINAQIDISGTRAEITNFSGSAGGGAVSAKGFVTLQRQPTFAMNLTAQSVRIRYPEGLRSILSGQINLQGSASGSTMTGRVLVDSLSFTQQFDLANFSGYFAQDSASGTPSAFANNMKLNVAVQSSQNINLASSKLSIGGSANFNVTGTLAQPVLLGRIVLASGEVFFLGKRFQLQSGTIQFANPARTEPVVNMYVSTRVEQYDVTLNLAGSVDHLRTNYSSDPALPAADIIHLLAFGNTTAEAASAPSQSAAMGAESVLAQGVSSRVSGKLESLTGVSQLTIDPLTTNSQGDPGARVAIQQRVTGSLLFTFSTNVSSTQSESVQLEYDLNRRTSVSILRDQNGGYGIDVRYHKVF